MSLLLAAVVLALAGSASGGSLPAGFLGVWKGTPMTSVLGPFSIPITFKVQPLAPAGSGWVMSDSLNHTSTISDSWQDFFIAPDMANLTYCGFLENYFSTVAGAPIQTPFGLVQLTNTSMQWCEVDYYSQVANCSLATWTLTLTDANTLDSHLQLAPPVDHVHVVFTRQHSESEQLLAPDAVFPTLGDFQCNFSNPILATSTWDRSDVRAKTRSCPFPHASLPAAQDEDATMEKREKQREKEKQVATSKLPYCVRLNDALGVRLQWGFDAAAQVLSVAISAAVDQTQWIAIGFQPEFPGMQGADIALGYPLQDGTACIQTLYADAYVGYPSPNNEFVISNQALSFTSNGTTTMYFERSFSTGHYTIPTSDPPVASPPTDRSYIMWAVGPKEDAVATDCGSFDYHGPNRGVRAITFSNPTYTFTKDWMC